MNFTMDNGNLRVDCPVCTKSGKPNYKIEQDRVIVYNNGVSIECTCEACGVPFYIKIYEHKKSVFIKTERR